MSTEQIKIITGTIVHCKEPFTLEIIENGYIMIESCKGKILALGKVEELEIHEKRSNLIKDEIIKLKKSQLLIPGLIDTHIHAPQYPNSGLGYDKCLLDWLNNYTYPLEKLYIDDEFSKKVYNAVVKKTLNNGTTTASYFGSLFLESSLILADAIAANGQRALIGKINMTRLAPEDYIESDEESIENTLIFIKNIKSRNNELIQPVITPRFALSLDMKLMQKLAQLAQGENLHIQSHIAENIDEVAMVEQTFHNQSYSHVYYDANLLTQKTILAHGIYLSDSEIELLRKSGTSISHCPNSNNNLKSGMCDVRKLLNNGIKIGLGTDISGGALPSIIEAMRSAIDVSVHLSMIKKDSNYKPLDYTEAFHLATLGGAQALAMDDKIGNFQCGKDFDAIIIDLNIEDSSADYLLDCGPKELLQKFIYLGDDRNVKSVFVKGKLVKE